MYIFLCLFIYNRMDPLNLNVIIVDLLQDNYMGWVNYSSWLLSVFPTSVPFMLNIDLGHILAQHGYTDNHSFLKSMFCLALSYYDALWWLITHAFVAVCRGPHSRPFDTHVRACSQGCGYAVARYKYPFGIGWSIEGKAARWLYIRHSFDGQIVFICQAWLS